MFKQGKHVGGEATWESENSVMCKITEFNFFIIYPDTDFRLYYPVLL